MLLPPSPSYEGTLSKIHLLVRSCGHPLLSPSCPLLIIQPIIGSNGCDLKVLLTKGLIQRSYLDASPRVQHDLKHQGQRELAASHSSWKPWHLAGSGCVSMLPSIILHRDLKSSVQCYKSAWCFTLICKNAYSLPRPLRAYGPRELPKENKVHAASGLRGLISNTALHLQLVPRAAACG